MRCLILFRFSFIQNSNEWFNWNDYFCCFFLIRWMNHTNRNGRVSESRRTSNLTVHIVKSKIEYEKRMNKTDSLSGIESATNYRNLSFFSYSLNNPLHFHTQRAIVFLLFFLPFFVYFERTYFDNEKEQIKVKDISRVASKQENLQCHRLLNGNEFIMKSPSSTFKIEFRTESENEVFQLMNEEKKNRSKCEKNIRNSFWLWVNWRDDFNLGMHWILIVVLLNQLKIWR